MSDHSSIASQPSLLTREDFPVLIEALQTQGYDVHAPVLRNGSVVWDTVSHVEDLPCGWQDNQQPGRYTLNPTESKRYFDIVHGPESLKRYTFAPQEPLLTIERKNNGFSSKPRHPQIQKSAFLGIRSCDLAGLGIQDHIFLNGPYPDPYYQTRQNLCC